MCTESRTDHSSKGLRVPPAVWLRRASVARPRANRCAQKQVALASERLKPIPLPLSLLLSCPPSQEVALHCQALF